MQFARATVGDKTRDGRLNICCLLKPAVAEGLVRVLFGPIHMNLVASNESLHPPHIPLSLAATLLLTALGRRG